MAGMDTQHVILIALLAVIAIFLVYHHNPYLFSSLDMYEGFADDDKAAAAAAAAKAAADKAAADKAAEAAKKAAADKAAEDAKKAAAASKTSSKFEDGPKKNGEGFADLSAYQGPAQFADASQPAGCYPRDQLTPSELLPKDTGSVWAAQNPMGSGSLKGKNFLSAGALIGVNTVGQSMRNANLQVRSEPPNPQVAVSIFNQSTISPDISHRPLEIGA
jgi:hypothetical protein